MKVPAGREREDTRPEVQNALPVKEVSHPSRCAKPYLSNERTPSKTAEHHLFKENIDPSAIREERAKQMELHTEYLTTDEATEELRHCQKKRLDYFI